MRESSESVVIDVIGIISLLRINVHDYWDKLTSGTTGIKPITQVEPSRFFSSPAGEVTYQEFSFKDFDFSHEIKDMVKFVQYSLYAAAHKIPLQIVIF